MTDTTLRTYESFLDEVATENGYAKEMWQNKICTEAAQRWGDHRFNEGMKADNLFKEKYRKLQEAVITHITRRELGYEDEGLVMFLAADDIYNEEGEWKIKELPALPSPINNKE